MTLEGKVVNGLIVPDTPQKLPEGARVKIEVQEPPEWTDEELSEEEWRQLVAHGLRNELNDPREDIYGPGDGEPVNGQG
jgi:hypothetical protein